MAFHEEILWRDQAQSVTECLAVVKGIPDNHFRENLERSLIVGAQGLDFDSFNWPPSLWSPP